MLQNSLTLLTKKLRSVLTPPIVKYWPTPFAFDDMLTSQKNSVDRLDKRKNLSWLDAHISEAEAKMVSEKNQLAALESQGLNTRQACRQLACTIGYLQILHIRKAALLQHLHELSY